MRPDALPSKALSGSFVFQSGLLTYGQPTAPRLPALEYKSTRLAVA